MNDLITVIVPVYNCQQYIKKCIDSILKQTYTNLEILIINDGSSDNTDEIVKSIFDKRIVYINKKNTGVSDCRNLGISIAKGEYLVFVDSDDCLDNNMIKVLYENITKNNIDVVRANYYIDRHDKIDYGPKYEFNNKILNRNLILKYVIPNIISHKIKGYVWLLIIKKEKLKIKFNTNLNILEDMKFYIDLFMTVDNVMFIDTKVYYYNCNNVNSATKSYKSYKNNMENMIVATYEIIKSLEHYNINDKYYYELLSTYNLNSILNYNYLLFKAGNDVTTIKELNNCIIKNDKYKCILSYYNKKYSKFSERIIYFLTSKKQYGILKNIFYIRKFIAENRRR